MRKSELILRGGLILVLEAVVLAALIVAAYPPGDLVPDLGLSTEVIGLLILITVLVILFSALVIMSALSKMEQGLYTSEMHTFHSHRDQLASRTETKADEAMEGKVEGHREGRL